MKLANNYHPFHLNILWITEIHISIFNLHLFFDKDYLLVFLRFRSCTFAFNKLSGTKLHCSICLYIIGVCSIGQYHSLCITFSDTSRFNLDSYRNRFIQLRKQQDTSLTNQPQFSYPTRPPPPLLYTNKLIVYLFIPLPSR